MRHLVSLSWLWLLSGVRSGRPDGTSTEQLMQAQQTCLTVCQKLSEAFYNTTFFPNALQYNLEKGDYFSQQQSELNPACFFLPDNKQQVAYAVQQISKSSCKFAVKSGGHARAAESSNIADGVTIILSRLKRVSVLPAEHIVQIGPGNRWHDVYVELEKVNLTVPGGRTGSVGVGGLILGGGISFFSGYHGFVCDNIINYQAVLATGDIVNLNRTSNSDLYWALRGGGNNFAIITRFDILTFTHDHMWGGIRTYNISHTPFLIEAFVDFGQNAPSDPGAYQITTLYNIRGKQFCTVDLYSVDPKPAPLLTHALDPIPHNDDTTAVQRQSKISWTNSVNQPDGYRQTYWTATFHLSRNFAHFIAAEFNEMTKLIQGIKGLQARCIMQILTADMLAHRRRNGGNALGLDYDEPLILLNPVLRWEDAADDAEIMGWSAEFVDRLTNEAKASDLHVPWLYTNYASELQDVWSGRRSDDLQRLRDISRKYDPEKVFQRLLPGGFKLGEMRVIEDGY